MAHWFVVQTKARQEQVAREHLARQAFETYLPTVRCARRRRSRWQGAVEPLFPGYLFVRLDTRAQNVAPIRSTRGVIGLVRFGNELRTVPDAVIDALSNTHQGDDDTPIDPSSLFKQGDPVQFVDGPLVGMSAIFEGCRGTERVAVLLSLLGRTKEVKVSPHAIAPLN